jgi:hypothetical protein
LLRVIKAISYTMECKDFTPRAMKKKGKWRLAKRSEELTPTIDCSDTVTDFRDFNREPMLTK